MDSLEFAPLLVNWDVVDPHSILETILYGGSIRDKSGSCNFLLVLLFLVVIDLRFLESSSKVLLWSCFLSYTMNLSSLGSKPITICCGA